MSIMSQLSCTNCAVCAHDLISVGLNTKQEGGSVPGAPRTAYYPRHRDLWGKKPSGTPLGPVSWRMRAWGEVILQGLRPHCPLGTEAGHSGQSSCQDSLGPARLHPGQKFLMASPRGVSSSVDEGCLALLVTPPVLAEASPGQEQGGSRSFSSLP